MKKMMVAVMLCLAMLTTGCSTAWVGQAEQIVAALSPAASNIVSLVALLQGKSVSTEDLQTIQNAGSQAGADLQLVQSLISQYEKADTATQSGILNQIQTAIGTAQTNLNGILPALHIKDTAAQTKITAVVGIVLSEVESLAAIVPLVKAKASPEMMALAQRQAKTRPPLGAWEFVSSYNSVMVAKTGNAELDQATSGLKIHLHGKVERWATAGVVK